MGKNTEVLSSDKETRKQEFIIKCYGKDCDNSFTIKASLNEMQKSLAVSEKKNVKKGFPDLTKGQQRWLKVGRCSSCEAKGRSMNVERKDREYYQVVMRNPTSSNPVWSPAETANEFVAEQHESKAGAVAEMEEVWKSGNTGLRKDLGIEFAVAKFVVSQEVLEETVSTV